MVMVSWKLERSLVEVIRFWLDGYSGIGSVRGMQFRSKYRGLQGGSVDRDELQPQYDGII
jgi:hypothetical protein